MHSFQERIALVEKQMTAQRLETADRLVETLTIEEPLTIYTHGTNDNN